MKTRHMIFFFCVWECVWGYVFDVHLYMCVCACMGVNMCVKV